MNALPPVVDTVRTGPAEVGVAGAAALPMVDGDGPAPSPASVPGGSDALGENGCNGPSPKPAPIVVTAIKPIATDETAPIVQAIVVAATERARSTVAAWPAEG